MSKTEIKSYTESSELRAESGELDDAALERVNGGIIAILIGLRSDTTSPKRQHAGAGGSELPMESLSLN